MQLNSLTQNSSVINIWNPIFQKYSYICKLLHGIGLTVNKYSPEKSTLQQLFTGKSLLSQY